MKLKKPLKIIVGVVIFFTLPSLLFFGFVYFKYNEDLPNGKSGPAAELLAQNMLNALDYEAYKNTNYLEWTFKNRHHFKWQKNEGTCMVYWKEYKVDLDLNNSSESKAYVQNFKVNGEQAEELITEATNYFNNDSFWLVAPYKVFDSGVERRIIKRDDGNDALLVTYTSGDTTPGDSYLWFLDKNNKPTKFKMWVDIIPIGGLEASWTDWTTTESGAQLPTFHELLFLGIQMGNVKGTK
jgi:hypothetical protein